MSRPTGVIVFGVLLIIFSTLTILGMLFSLIIIGLASASPAFQQVSSQYNTTYTVISGIYSLIIGIIGLVSGIGILMLKFWARKLLIILAITVIIIGLINLIILFLTEWDIRTILSSLIGYVLGVVFYGLILWYFNKPEIKSVFA